MAVYNRVNRENMHAQWVRGTVPPVRAWPTHTQDRYVQRAPSPPQAFALPPRRSRSQPCRIPRTRPFARVESSGARTTAARRERPPSAAATAEPWTSICAHILVRPLPHPASLGPERASHSCRIARLDGTQPRARSPAAPATVGCAERALLPGPRWTPLAQPGRQRRRAAPHRCPPVGCGACLPMSACRCLQAHARRGTATTAPGARASVVEAAADAPPQATVAAAIAAAAVASHSNSGQRAACCEAHPGAKLHVRAASRKELPTRRGRGGGRPRCQTPGPKPTRCFLFFLSLSSHIPHPKARTAFPRYFPPQLCPPDFPHPIPSHTHTHTHTQCRVHATARVPWHQPLAPTATSARSLTSHPTRHPTAVPSALSEV
eukprot:158793-Chlamydomonas_euryale.AAC.14